MRLAHSSVLVSSALLLVGCTDHEPPTAPQSPQTWPAIQMAAVHEVRMASQGRRQRGFEDEILRLESDIPGLGGISLGADDRAIVYLKDLKARSAAVARLNLAAGSMNVDHGMRSALASSNIDIRQGAFSFSELVALEHLAAGRLRHAGVVSLDADEARNRVRIGVLADADSAAIVAAVTDGGVPAEAILIERRPRNLAAASLRDSIRATGGGVQIDNSNGLGGRCTLGYNVTTYAYNEVGFLTAGHCVPGAYGVGSTGDAIYQNTNVTARQIGTVSNDPAWSETAPECMSYTLCTNADVMFVATTDSAHAWSKRVAQTTSMGVSNTVGSITLSSWWTGISGVPFMYQGMVAHKVGRTTGWTRGRIAATCDNPVIGGSYGSYVVLCANRVDSASVGGGDSGSPVFYPPVSPDPFYAMGILFAGANMSVYDSGDQTYHCTSSCSYYFNTFDQIRYHILRYVQP